MSQLNLTLIEVEVIYEPMQSLWWARWEKHFLPRVCREVLHVDLIPHLKPAVTFGFNVARSALMSRPCSKFLAARFKIEAEKDSKRFSVKTAVVNCPRSNCTPAL